ncbi:MAG: hypothetical protein MMC23_002281 [Stictis urceolatum]|nr:hypothetical protein [Stictis urceolata]
MHSSNRGEARVLPVFVSQLLVVEALSGGGKIAALGTPQRLEQREFSAYVVYIGTTMKRMVVLNMKPAYAGQTAGVVELDIGKHNDVSVKRMTAPSVDKKDSAKATYTGLSYSNAKVEWYESFEQIVGNGSVKVRDS